MDSVNCVVDQRARKVDAYMRGRLWIGIRYAEGQIVIIKEIISSVLYSPLKFL